MICCSPITLVHPFNNNDDDFFFFMVFLMLLLQRCSHDQSLEVRLPAEIQTWVIKNDRIIWFWLSLSSFFFFMEIFYSSVYKIVWFDHFTHWFLLIGNMSLPSVSMTRSSLLLNQSFLLCIRRERNLIKKMGRVLSTRKSYPMPTLRYSTNVPRRQPVSNQRWCIFFFLFFFFTVIVQMLDIQYIVYRSGNLSLRLLRIL